MRLSCRVAGIARRRAACRPVPIAVRLRRVARRLQHGLGQLLDEQRHAVGPGDDLLQDGVGQRPPARHRLGEGSALPAGQAVQRDQRRVRPAPPGRRELGAEGQQQQHPLARDPPDQPVEQLQRGRVGPVQVLEDAQHRLPAGEAGHLLDQDVDRRLPLPLRRRGERRVAPLRRDGQERRDQRGGLARPVRPSRQQGLELVQLGGRRVVPPEAGGPLQVLDRRVERGVDVVGRALVVQPHVRLALEALAEGAGDAGLADPGLAREQHHLALAVAGLLPTVEQERHLLLAPDQRRQAGRARLEPAARPRARRARATPAPARQSP